MQQFQNFFIEGWEVIGKETLEFSYSFDNNTKQFSETITFPGVDLYQYDEEQLRPYCDPLAIMLGVSYYKLFPVPYITLQHTSLTKNQEKFRITTYRKGLGEFYYTNKIDPFTLKGFKVQEGAQLGQNKSIQPSEKDNQQLSDQTLLLWGGGKDSIVSYELIKQRNNGTLEKFNENIDTKVLNETGPTDTITLFTFGRPFQIHLSTAKIAGAEHLMVERSFPLKKMQEWIDKGYYSGHVPKTGIISFVSILLSKLYGFREIVLSAEKSANSENLEWKGMKINHQWSKSSEFVGMAQDYFNEYINANLSFINPLENLYERQIAKLFTQYKEYFPVFSSCNRNFHITDQSPKGRWCKKCPKCLFVYMILRPFITEDEVEQIRGEELYAKEELLPLAKKIRGFVGTKPFECVGTAEESVLMTQRFVENNQELAKMFSLTNAFMSLHNKKGQK